MSRQRAHAIITSGVIALFGVSVRACKTPCTSNLRIVDEPIGDLDALPEEASLEDARPPEKHAGCFEHGSETHWAKLGPFLVHYEAWDYKGQTVTTNIVMNVFDASCTDKSVPFTMLTRGAVRLRHDKKRDLWIISNANERRHAIALRR